jgi:hypothetical protein
LRGAAAQDPRCTEGPKPQISIVQASSRFPRFGGNRFRTRQVRGRLVLFAPALAGLTACGDPAGVPPVRLDPGLRAMGGAGQVDTIGAFLPALLMVTVATPDGLPLGGRAVHATPLRTAADEPTMLALRLVAPFTYADEQQTSADTTNASGLVAFRLRLGQRAGAAGVVLRAEGMNPDTVWFEVLAGSPHRVRAEPRDSAVLVGGAYAIRSAVVDRADNVLTEPVAARLLDGPVALGADGTVTGWALGRARLLVEGAALADTVFVSVVPEGTLAAYIRPLQPGGQGRLVVFRTDGAQHRVIVERTIPFVGPPSYGFWPAWSPAGDRIVFLDAQRFESVDVATGDATPLDPAGDEPIAEEYPPEFDRFGEWLYFTRGYLGSQNTIWRMRPDGRDASQVSPPADWGLEQRGSPDPDGRRVVYSTNRAAEQTIRVLDLETGDTTDLAPGRFPRWSPDGRWIGYGGADGLRVVRPDGSGDRAVGVGGFEPSFDWSPDSEWVVIDTWVDRVYSRLELVHLASGLRLPLGYTRDMVMGTWRR